jgi:hypothetical protein
MDKKQTKPSSFRKRWSAVDTLIVLLVLLAVAGVVVRVVYAAHEENEAAGNTVYEVYFEVAETHQDTLAELRGFEALYLYDNGMKLGHMGVYEDEATGEYRPALTVTPAEGATGAHRVTAKGCMICTAGSMTDGGLLVEGSGRYLTPGSVLQVRTDRVYMTVRIIEIRAHS